MGGIDTLTGTRNASRPSVARTNPADPASRDVERQVEKLKAVERKVVAHEQAHRAAGGRYAGSVGYSYTQGPDGKRYVTGGEVPIDVSPERTPEETVRKMRQVAAAALAPAEPSGQDYAVAARASAAEARARAEIARAGSVDLYA